MNIYLHVLFSCLYIIINLKLVFNIKRTTLTLVYDVECFDEFSQWKFWLSAFSHIFCLLCIIRQIVGGESVSCVVCVSCCGFMFVEYLRNLSLLWQTFVAKHQNQNLEFCESVDFFWSEFGHFVFVLGLIHGHQAWYSMFIYLFFLS